MIPIDFSGKVALVTGSSRNLGAVIARALAERGAEVAVHYAKHADDAQRMARQIQESSGIAEVFRADVGDSGEVRRLAAEVLARFGRVDMLVNNVGPYADIPLLDLPEDVWDAALNSNVKASYLLTQALAPGMKQRGWGRIVNLAAVSAFVRVHSVYGLAKAAVIHLTESLALELAPEIRVNAIAPGQIQESDEIELIAPGYIAQMTEATPLRRLVTRQEVADAACLLCSDRLPSLTGQTLVLDGGWSLPVGRKTPVLNVSI